jgi:hypothetical protein
MVHDRAFYRELVELGLLPADFDVEGMRLPGEPPPRELETHELARLERDEVEPAAWAGLDPAARWFARREAHQEWRARIGALAVRWVADPATAPERLPAPETLPHSVPARRSCVHYYTSRL